MLFDANLRWSVLRLCCSCTSWLWPPRRLDNWLVELACTGNRSAFSQLCFEFNDSCGCLNRRSGIHPATISGMAIDCLHHVHPCMYIQHANPLDSYIQLLWFNLQYYWSYHRYHPYSDKHDPSIAGFISLQFFLGGMVHFLSGH